MDSHTTIADLTCWLDPKDQVLSFHAVDEAVRVTFPANEALRTFVREKVHEGYRVQ